MVGVTVSEISSETRIAIESVTANSWNSRPTIPGINKIGMNTAISDRLMEITVKLTSALPASAASRTLHAGFEVPHDVLEHHHRIVDDETGGDGERHQREIVDAVAEQVHRAEGAHDGQRQNHRRYQRRARRLQEHEHHADDQHHGDYQGCARCRSPPRSPIASDRGQCALCTLGGRVASTDGSTSLDLGDGLDDVGAGQRIDDHAHRRPCRCRDPRCGCSPSESITAATSCSSTRVPRCDRR